MTRSHPSSFVEYQESLLERGMAISADCTHEDYGSIIFNEVVRSPSSDLLTTMRRNVIKALHGKFEAAIRDEIDCWGKSNEEYMEELLQDFQDEQHTRKSIKMPLLEWIDKNDPRKGIMVNVTDDFSSHFDLRVSLSKLSTILGEELSLEIDLTTDKKIRQAIDEAIEEWEICIGDGTASCSPGWSEMVLFGWFVDQGCRSERKFRELKTNYLNQSLSPIFTHYKAHCVFIAARDTTYFEISRPLFYPIIAGENFDGSHEITIFEALNEI